MAIDLPASASAALRSLQNSLATSLGQRQDALRAAFNAVNIREGEAVEALVKAVTQVDERLRMRLINLANPVTASDAGGKPRPATHAAQSATVASTDLDSLLKSASLKLAELDIRGKTLLTFTDRALQPGAKVQVQARQGQLLLVPQAAKQDSASQTPEKPAPAIAPRDYTAVQYDKAGQTAALPRSGGHNQGQPGPAQAAPRESPAQQYARPGAPPVTRESGGLPPSRPAGAELAAREPTARQHSGPPQPASVQESSAQQPAKPARMATTTSGVVESTPARIPVAQAPTNEKTLQASHVRALTQALREHLPQQAPPRVLGQTLEFASILSRLLMQPVNRGLRAEIPPSVQASLRTVANFLRTPAQLSQPGQLKQSIFNSGLQMEHRLAQQAGQLQQSTAADNASGEGALRRLLTTTLPRSDLKAALEGLAKQLVELTPGAQRDQPLLTPPLIAQLKHWAYRSTAGEAANRQVTAQQLLSHMQQRVGQALDKIVVQQLQSLQQAHAGNELTPTQHWQLEIPLRYGHELNHLQLRIDEEWVEEYTGEEQATARKVQQWMVKLSFDLPDAGTLHAHLCVVENAVSASLWAEQSDTLQRARLKLADLQQGLEKAGVKVAKIECFAGRPVQEEIRFNYSLVDIRT